ncbi:hypothetical protein IFM89_010676 [Coptis chinensis]|uniref:Uncharacterized protein n=1 Tax=Coptis chinensis TaxID=261450 RepID=A0A835HDL5_9MAGN|nr:hypothetical protein IFM89_010676 [Coptis chinensis]
MPGNVLNVIGPICCTKDGLYLAGGTSTGYAHVWEVSSGRMLKSWRAHMKSIKCITFSSDNSLLISGSSDGEIHQECTPEALQMKVDTSVEMRVWATGMAKDMMDMNMHL